jgi:hypothetical protein
MRRPDLSKLSFAGGVPTMIVPPGTLIQVDPQGQVSIRTPGNLVMQNSGAYAVLESVSGSIRVEPGVHVEAVTVRCADTCFVQGTLTAWRLVARTLHVDGDAEARVVMQETEHLEVARNGRVVGNFRSEKELFALFSRFANHVRALPSPLAADAAVVPDDAIDGEVEASEAPGLAEPPGVAAGGNGTAAAADARATAGPSEAAASAAAEPGGVASAPQAELPDALYLAWMLLEQEQGARWSPAQRRVLDELLGLLRQGDVETLRHTFKTLFARLADGGEGVRRARRAVGDHFEAASGHAAV